MTNAIRMTFDHARVLLPVVHCIDTQQVQAQADVALEHGADGIWLINQGGMDDRGVLYTAEFIARERPGLFIGVNLLGLGRKEIEDRLVSRRSPVVGLWTDTLIVTRFRGLYFGSVAFKGQPPVDPSRWGKKAREAMILGADVVTTSGPATGQPAPIEKVQAMRKVLGDHALALASGVAVDNVAQYLPFVDAFLVASSLERSFGEFDPGRLQALADVIHAFPASEVAY